MIACQLERARGLYYYRRMNHRSTPRVPLALRLALLTLASALLAGCLSTETTITLDRDGGGTLELSYEIDRVAWETGVFDKSDLARAIPVTEHEFAAAAQQIAGLRLRSHRTESDEQTVLISARLDFDSPDSLARFLGAESVELTMDGRSGRWRQIIAPGGGSTDEGARELAASFEGYALRFVLDPPEPVRSTNGTVVRAADAAEFSVSLSEIMTATEPLVWEVAW